MLREHASVFGRTENYTVYNQTDVRRVIEWLRSDQQRAQIQQALADHGQPAVSSVLAEIPLAKNRLLTPHGDQHAAPACRAIGPCARYLPHEPPSRGAVIPNQFADRCRDAMRQAGGACPIEAGPLGRLADNKCAHGRLPGDRTRKCGRWPQENAAVIALTGRLRPQPRPARRKAA